MFGNTQMAGTDLGFPDVCLTPAAPAPVPLPYPNVASGPAGSPAAYKVLFMAAPAHTLATSSVPTTGDNPALPVGGVASGTSMGPSRHLTGSFTVLLVGMPASKLSSMTLQNSTNVPGARIAPSQLKVLLLAP